MGILPSDTHTFGARCLAEWGPATASALSGSPLSEWNLCFTHELEGGLRMFSMLSPYLSSQDGAKENIHLSPALA